MRDHLKMLCLSAAWHQCVDEFLCVQPYTVKPEVYNFGILLSPLEPSEEGPKASASQLWLQHRTA